MFDLFKDALGWIVQAIADLVSFGFHALMDPVLSGMRSMSGQTAQYVDMVSGGLLPYLNAADQWIPVSYCLFLLQSFFLFVVAFAVYKVAMKVLPHFGS